MQIASPWTSHRPMPKVNAQKVVDTFRSVADIWAPSGQEKEMADKMIADFRALNIPGTRIQVDDAAERAGSDTGNVIVDIPASPEAPKDAKSIVLSFHLDRVPVRAPGVPDDEPVQVEETKDGVIQSKGHRTNIAADDRAGYTAIKEGIRHLELAGYPHGKIRVIGFVREETGLHGARELDSKYLDGMDYGFEMDGGKAGNVIRGSAGIQRFRINILGEGAPSIRPGEGKNALLAGVDLVTQLNNWEKGPGQTLNVSNFYSGRMSSDGMPVTNAVADEALIAGEIRARQLDDESKLFEHVQKAVQDTAARHGVEAKIQFEALPRFEVKPDSEVVQLAELATRAAGFKPKTITMMGGSDANHMNAKGLPTVVLGCGGYAQHTVKEYTTRNELVRATQVVMSVIAGAAMLGGALGASVAEAGKAA